MRKCFASAACPAWLPAVCAGARQCDLVHLRTGIAGSQPPVARTGRALQGVQALCDKRKAVRTSFKAIALGKGQHTGMRRSLSAACFILAPCKYHLLCSTAAVSYSSSSLSCPTLYALCSVFLTGEKEMQKQTGGVLHILLNVTQGLDPGCFVLAEDLEGEVLEVIELVRRVEKKCVSRTFGSD